MNVIEFTIPRLNGSVIPNDSLSYELYLKLFNYFYKKGIPSSSLLYLKESPLSITDLISLILQMLISSLNNFYTNPLSENRQ